MLPKIVIMGRPNAGKSTLFNRIIGRRKALTHETPYLTRDAIHETFKWNGYDLEFVDTAGMDMSEKNKLNLTIIRFLKRYIADADIILFVLDGMSQISLLDEQIANLLRKSNKEVIEVINKVDDRNVLKVDYEFHKFGFKTVHMVSGIHGTGVADLLDSVTALVAEKGFKKPVVKKYDAEEEEEKIKTRRNTKKNPRSKKNDEAHASQTKVAKTDEGEEALEVFGGLGSEDAAEQNAFGQKIAIIGQPNSGKSSYLNAMLGFERNVVDDVPGTTRDSIDTHIEYKGHKLTLIDTAGIRKNTSSYDRIESYSVNRALKTLERCDVAIILIDIMKGITFQDKHILDVAFENGKGVVIAFNKIDLVKKTAIEELKKQVVDYLHQEFPDSRNVPCYFMSTLKDVDVEEPLEAAVRIYENVMSASITTSMLNTYITEIVALHPPASFKGRMLKIYYSTMVSKTPPSIVMFVNNVTIVSNSYKNYLVNKLRNAFQFEGYPVRIFFKKSESEDSPKK
ncbi:MAG TPA: ribosome biogenesis GTPase Der [Candidatus Wallbacteria bacterium]|nr:ribosome biogenesis GTPase Der [Candidatus Wallbacteria bacterium]